MPLWNYYCYIAKHLQLRGESHLAAQGEHHASEDADEGVKEVEHFLCCPAVLWHPLLDAHQLDQGNQGNEPIGHCQGDKRVLLPFGVMVDPLPPMGQSLEGHFAQVGQVGWPHHASSIPGRGSSDDASSLYWSIIPRLFLSCLHVLNNPPSVLC